MEPKDFREGWAALVECLALANLLVEAVEVEVVAEVVAAAVCHLASPSARCDSCTKRVNNNINPKQRY